MKIYQVETVTPCEGFEIEATFLSLERAKEHLIYLRKGWMTSDQYLQIVEREVIE